MEEKKKCHIEECDQEAEYQCKCPLGVYSCQAHEQDHILYSQNQGNHHFARWFKIPQEETKKALFELLKAENSKKEELKKKAAILFNNFIQASAGILQEYMEGLADDSEKIIKWFNLTMSTKKVSIKESDEILSLLPLHPEEAVEKAKSLIPNRPESYDINKMRYRFRHQKNESADLGHIKANFENFLTSFDRIESILGENDLYIKSIINLSAKKLEYAKASTWDLVRKIELRKSFLSNEVEFWAINPHKDVEIQYESPIYSKSSDDGTAINVYSGMLKNKKTEVAIKKFKSKDAVKVKKYEKEARILQIYNGKNSAFLDYYGMHKEVILEGEETFYLIYLVMELCGCSLIDIINDPFKKPQNMKEKFITEHIFGAISYLENSNIHHCDITPHNILISKTGKSKIISFGAAKILNGPEIKPKLHKPKGKWAYMAPEIKQQLNIQDPSSAPKKIKYMYNKADAYALGLVVASFVDLQNIEKMNDESQLKWINKFKESKPGLVSKLLGEMLNPNPTERLTLKESVSRFSEIRSDPMLWKKNEWRPSTWSRPQNIVDLNVKEPEIAQIEIITAKNLMDKRSKILKSSNNSAELENEFRSTSSLYQNHTTVHDASVTQAYQDYLTTYHQKTSLFNLFYKDEWTADLLIYNTETETQESKVLQTPLDWCTCITQLPNGKLFCFGSGNSPGITLLIDVNNDCRVEELPSGTACGLSSAIYFNNNVYCFGGYYKGYLTLSRRFDLDRNKWNELTPLPNADAGCKSIIFNGSILISGYDNKNLWRYSIDNNSFITIPYEFAEKKRKILINAERLYLIECGENGSIYESEIGSDSDWRRITDSTIDFTPTQTYCQYNKGGIYIWLICLDLKIIKYKSLCFKFNLNEKRLNKLFENTLKLK